MEILASCTLEESTKFEGKLLIEGEEGAKPDKVFLNVVVEDGNLSILNNLNSNIKCVTYRGDVDFSEVEIPSNKVFVEVDYPTEEIPHIDGVTTLVRLPDGFSDMRTVFNLCMDNPHIRVIGGNLLNIEGVRIGRYDSGKDKGSVVYNGVYDQFLEAPLSELGNLKDVVKKARKRLESSNGEKRVKSSKEKKATPKRNNIAKSFSSLFSNTEEEEF